MVKIKILLVLIVCCCAKSNTSAQINIGIGQSCLDYNHAIMSDAIISIIGEETWSWLIEERIVLRLALKVDSLGNIIGLARFGVSQGHSSLTDSVPNWLINGFFRLLKTKNLHLKICYENDTNQNEKSFMVMVSELARKTDLERGSTTVIVAVPNLHWLFDYELANRTNPISRFDYYHTKMSKAIDYYE
jgi:hypothetical protein